ncbi:MAG: hypothetical protein LBE82_04745 [Chitinophagaceae bacterium]|jgi:hypothetical protein|nr:hypothetical protein [Chitinophagaceae bacterium]
MNDSNTATSILASVKKALRKSIEVEKISDKSRLGEFLHRFYISKALL